MDTSDYATASETLKIETTRVTTGEYPFFQIWALVSILLPEIHAAMIRISPVFIGVNYGLFDESPKCFFVYDEANPDVILSNDRNCSETGTSYKTRSIYEEWNLLDDRAWLLQLLLTIQMVGMMCGGLIASQVIDRLGSKNVYYASNILMAVCGIVSFLSNDVIIYVIIKFLVGIGIGSYRCYVTHTIYVTESTVSVWRTICRCISLWFLSEMVLPLGAYYISSWRGLALFATFPLILGIMAALFVLDNPRHRRYQKITEVAEKIFRKITGFNEKPALNNSTTQQHQEIVHLDLNTEKVPIPMKEKSIHESNENKSSVVQPLCGDRQILIQTLLFAFGWFCIAFVFYGISFTTMHKSRDRYLNMLYFALVDTTAFPFTTLLSNWLGHRKTYTLYLALSAVFFFTMTEETLTIDFTQYPALISVLCYLGRWSLAGTWAVVTSFTAESFPTAIRSTVLSRCSIAASFAGVVAAQLISFGSVQPQLVYPLYGIPMLLAACSSRYLKEVDAKSLQDFVN